jgi:hypothetical protein
MTLMKQLASADFRKKYTAQSEPVEVTAHGKVIGRWIPVNAIGTEVDTSPNGVSEDASEDDEAPRMTIRPAKGPKKAIVGTPQRVLDPLEAARRERERYAQLASRMYGTKRAPERQ